MRTLPIALVAALACTTAQRSNAQPSVGSTAIPAGSAAGSAAPTRNQPPYIKLKLGHYTNKKLGIGVVIDLSEASDNVARPPPGKLRFDGESKTWRLKGKRASRDGIDYSNDEGHLMLQSYDDGRRSVFVLDPTTDKWSDEIPVERDGDADPL